MPLSPNVIFKIYEVPELSDPQINKFVMLSSKVNSSVQGLIPHKKIPTQNPTHIGHDQKYPVGRMRWKIRP